MSKTKVSLDCGNAQIKIVTDEGEFMFPHALRQLSESDRDALHQRGELDSTEGVYNVGGLWYAAGEKAMRRGSNAALYGERRYVETYYGVLGAIALWHGLDSSAKDIIFFGSHTPKDVIYKQNLIASIRKEWRVSSMGLSKTFVVREARTFDEPVGAFRHAMLSDDGRTVRGDRWLRDGALFVIDVGGFTVSLTAADAGKVDYSSAASRMTGILQVLRDFEQLIRRRYASQLFGTNGLDPVRLRDALANGQYDARGMGVLDVRDQAEQACAPLVNDIAQFYEEYGGAGNYNGILIAGGGGALLEKRLRDTLRHPHMTVAEMNRDRMHFGTAWGGMKIMRAAESAGKL